MSSVHTQKSYVRRIMSSSIGPYEIYTCSWQNYSELFYPRICSFYYSKLFQLYYSPFCNATSFIQHPTTRISSPRKWSAGHHGKVKPINSNDISRFVAINRRYGIRQRKACEIIELTVWVLSFRSKYLQDSSEVRRVFFKVTHWLSVFLGHGN